MQGLRERSTEVVFHKRKAVVVEELAEVGEERAVVGWIDVAAADFQRA